MIGLKSDLRGIETGEVGAHGWGNISLKSDLRGIETPNRRCIILPYIKLKSDLRGIETHLIGEVGKVTTWVKIRP